MSTPQRYKYVGKIAYPIESKDLKILGMGAYATVVKGVFGEREVAVKRIKVSEDNERSVESELRHVYLYSHIGHENVAQYFHMEKANDMFHLVMELCSGTLENLITPNEDGKPRGSVMSIDDNMEIMRQIIAGLGYLHSKKIVHRDLKPQNILISFAGFAKLADFGMSKQLRPNATSFTKTGRIGSEGWAAPELLDSAGRFRFAVDVFSLGCVFGYILTLGKHPFGNDVKRSERVKNGELYQESVELVENEELRQLVEMMVSFDPQHRPDLQFIGCVIIGHLLKISSSKKLFDSKDELKSASMETTIDKLISNTKSTNDEDNAKKLNLLLLLFCKTLNRNRSICVSKLISSLSSGMERFFTESKNNQAQNALAAFFESSIEEDDVIQVTKLLINSGINLNERTCNGDTVLGLAIKNISLSIEQKKILPDLVKLLLDNGADPNVCNNDGWSPLNLVCRYYREDDLVAVLTTFIERRVQYDSRPECGNNALTLLTRYYQGTNMLEAVTLLIEASVDVNSKDKENTSALMTLCRYYENQERLFTIVKFLIAKNVNVKNTNIHGSNALNYLMIRNFEENREPDVSHEIVEILLENGADADLVDENKWTPLLLACSYYRKHIDFARILKLLIKYKADPDRRTPSGLGGDNALTLVTGVLLKETNIYDLIDTLIKAGADVSCQGMNKYNALMNLCQNYIADDQLIQTMELLIHKAREEEKDIIKQKAVYGWSILHFALAPVPGSTTIALSTVVDFLLQHGAEADALNEQNQSPLMMACERYQNEDLINVVRLLIGAGAKTVHQFRREIADARKIVNKNYRLSNKNEIIELLSKQVQS